MRLFAWKLLFVSRISIAITSKKFATVSALASARRLKARLGPAERVMISGSNLWQRKVSLLGPSELQRTLPAPSAASDTCTADKGKPRAFFEPCSKGLL